MYVFNVLILIMIIFLRSQELCDTNTVKFILLVVDVHNRSVRFKRWSNN